MSRFVQSLQAFAYSLLDGRACPYNTTETRPSYYLETLRLRPSSLYGRRFSAEVGGDFLQYPSESVFRTEPTSEVGQAEQIVSPQLIGHWEIESSKAWILYSYELGLATQCAIISMSKMTAEGQG